jgi:predicted transcriptional regulator
MGSRKYRSPADIVVALLRACEDGGSKRSIMFGAFIDHRQGTKYLDFLEEKGLVAVTRAGYEITSRGEELLAELSGAVDLLDALDEVKEAAARRLRIGELAS